MAIGAKEWMLGFASPAHTDLVGILHMICDTGAISKIYDTIFANAIEPYDFINEVKNGLQC
jgi:hypothetical protein